MIVVAGALDAQPGLIAVSKPSQAATFGHWSLQRA
jgi:hypothetical protein